MLATAPEYDEDRACAQLAFMGSALFPGMSVFELGCGQGSLAVWLKSTLGEVTYHGLEPSPHALSAENAMDAVWRSWEDFQTTDHHYDLIIASHVLEHIPDVDVALSILASRLREGGTIFLEVPNRSGHPRLPRDTNPGHLHFFSAASITRLLARHQLNVDSIVSGSFESHRYPDSLRITAKPLKTVQVKGDELAENLATEPGESLVIWGAGGMARELLDPYFPADLVHCILDANPNLKGTTLMGRPIQPPEYLQRLNNVALLISSLDYEAEIRKEVAEKYNDQVSRIISMKELLN